MQHVANVIQSLNQMTVKYLLPYLLPLQNMIIVVRHSTWTVASTNIQKNCFLFVCSGAARLSLWTHPWTCSYPWRDSEHWWRIVTHCYCQWHLHKDCRQSHIFTDWVTDYISTAFLFTNKSKSLFATTTNDELNGVKTSWCFKKINDFSFFFLFFTFCKFLNLTVLARISLFFISSKTKQAHPPKQC